MARIKAFRFKWTDAWNMIDYGYDSTLELSDTSNITIQFLVNNTPFILDITERENEFIEDFTFLIQWNKKHYYQDWICDGTMWRLYFTYDDTSIVANGDNGFPTDFIDFIKLLHRKYNVPKASIEDEKHILQDIKRTKIIEDPNLDSKAMYL